VTVRSGARAPSTGLNSEEVVEKGDYVVVVEVPVIAVDEKRDDRQSLGLLVPKDVDIRVFRPRFDGPVNE
jgi:hypothetical protein